MTELNFSRAEIWQTPTGNWVALNVDKNHLQSARRFIDDMKESKQYKAEIKEYKPRRSLDSNAYFWVLAGKVAAALGCPPAEVYRRLIPDIPNNRDIICVPNKSVDKLIEGWQHNGLGWIVETFPSKLEGCTNAMLYYGSSTYDTAQMSQLIDLIVQECKQLGIETMTPRELALLMEDWDAKKN
jgi:hypothetical protein